MCGGNNGLQRKNRRIREAGSRENRLLDRVCVLVGAEARDNGGGDLVAVANFKMDVRRIEK